MDAIEALADAIMQFEGWRTGSRSWRNRNPGNLRPYSTGQPQDGDGYRTFDTLADGWATLRLDLTAKFRGSHGLTPDSTLLDLLSVYAPAGDANNPSAYTSFVCRSTTQALARPIAPTTSLRDYLGGMPLV